MGTDVSRSYVNQTMRKIADVDTDMMDLSAPAQTLVIHDELSLDADERGVPATGQRAMSKADRCNVNTASLIAMNLVPEKLSDRFDLGAVEPETTALSADSLADYQELIHEPIECQLKMEVSPFKGESAWKKQEPTPRTHRDMKAFRSKQR